MRGKGGILGIVMGCGSLFIAMMPSSAQEERALHAEDKKIKQYTEDLKEFLKEHPLPKLKKKHQRFLDEVAFQQKDKEDKGKGIHQEECGQKKDNNIRPFQHPIRVYISLGVPVGVWKSYQADVMKLGGIFVVRGLPDNSFEAFYREAERLKKEGVTAPIIIDPKAFSRHGIKRVPVVEVRGQGGVSWMKGAVGLPYVLDYLAERTGDPGITSLRDSLYGRDKREEGER